MTPEERRRRLLDAEKAGRELAQGVYASFEYYEGEGPNRKKKKREKLKVEGHPPRELHEEMGHRIFNHERQRNQSKFFSSNSQAYILDGVGRSVYPITQDDGGFNAWLNTRYGLSKSDQRTRLVVEFLRDRTVVYADSISPSKFSHYDRERNVLFIDANNGQAWRIDGKSPPRLVLNGEGVFFLSNGNSPSLIDADVGPHGLLLDYLVNDLNYAPVGKYTPAAQRHLFAAWLHLLAFGDWDELSNGKPILVVEGAMRSGKTMAVKRVAALLNGYASPMIVTETGEADFSTQLQHSTPIAHFDNQDRLVKWMPDALAAYSTSGVWRRRKLRTDGDLFEVRPTCFVAISSADPQSARRSDVADRCITLRLVQFKSGTEGHEGILMRRINENRDKLIGEWLHNLNRIVAALPDTFVERPTSRLVTWETFFSACREPLGFEAEVDALAQLRDERLEFTVEDDPTIDWFDRWLEIRDNRRRQLEAVKMHEIISEFSTQGNGESSFTKRWPTAMAFAKWIANATEVLSHKGFVLEKHQNPDRRRYGTPVYSLDRAEE
jgi:hypothetical protein